MNNLYIRVFYDSSNIKDASVWKIALVDDESHMLYIETLHDKVSDKIPESVYLDMTKKSYFKGLVGADATLATLKLVDKLGGEGSTDINIFVDTDEKIRKKILTYLDKFFEGETDFTLYFKDSFEEVLFFNFICEELNKFNITTMTLDNKVCDPRCEKYNSIVEKSITQSMNELEGNDEMRSLFMYMRIIIEDLLLKDLFTYIFND